MHPVQPISVAVERARIVRELADVVAHSISVMTVQAAAADAFLERDPAQAREHLDTVRRTVHDALDEMRRLCGVLRDDTATLLPQPTLDRICELVAGARHAGVQLVLLEEGERPELPPGLGLAAFRILQEALANVRKHAGAVPASVRIAYCADRIDIVVMNVTVPGSGETGRGHGLAAMAERARVYGGRLEAGIQPDGTYALRAILPL